MQQTNWDDRLDATVLEHIRYTARRASHFHAVPGMDSDDLEQDLFLHLWSRRDAHNPLRASFRTFASRVVANRMATLTAPSTRRNAERAMISLDSPISNDNPDTLADHLVDPDGAGLDHEYHGLVLDVRRFIASLTPALQRCCAILLAPNISNSAIAAGIHRSTVYENAERLRKLAVVGGLRDYVVGPYKSDQRPVYGHNE